MRVPCDPTSGFSYQYQNVAETSNKGLEFNVQAQIVRSKDFNLSFGLTYNYNINKVDKLADGVNANAHTNWGSTMRLPNYDYIVKVGEPVGLVSGYKSLGFYTVNDFDMDYLKSTGVWKLKEGVKDCTIGNYVGQQNYNLYVDDEGKKQSAFPGMAKFEDIDGDGMVTDKDVTIIGRTTPKHTGGFNIQANYMGFDFSANFAYQIGGDVYNANVMYDMMGNKDTGYGYQRLKETSETWKMYNVNAAGDLYAVTDPTELANLNAGAKYALPYSEYGICSSQFIEDASFLRLQTLTVGYSLPKNIIKKIGISNLRVYVTASNLFCLKKYSGLDPDVNVSPNADSDYSGFPTTNYDFRSYPKSRSYTFGLNVAF